MTKSKTFFYFCLSFIIGIFIGSAVKISQLAMLGILILGVLLIFVLWEHKKAVGLGLFLIFLAAGVWHYQLAELKIANNELRKYNDSKETATLIGFIESEPKKGEKSAKLIIEIEKLNGNKTKGKVLITTSFYPQYRYGDKLKIRGYLENPPVFESFNYQDYLKKDGIYSVMNWPNIELLGNNFGNPIYRIIFSFKDKFEETARKFISPPQEGILEALLFGEEENISKTWKDKLNLTGTRHITAVSGMNITIIGFIIISFALSIGFWRRQALFISIFSLFLYILMVGAPASAIRAGIMGGLLIIAQYFNRLSSAQRTIFFAAALMLIFNPLLLRLDIGFQLSFLAMMGIVYLQPIFTNLLKKVSGFKVFSIRTTLAAALSAQVFTLPILIYNFGYFSLVSPITNILIVPILAPLTILIFIFGIAGMFFWLFGWLLSWPVWFCLIYITEIVDFFSHPWLAKKINGLHWIWLIIFYSILGVLTWRLKKKERLKFLDYDY